jgi:outer membrane receptor protein involved in Fe transport
VPVYGDVNSERLPAYTRLDASASYRLVRENGRSYIVFASVTNVFARRNSFEYAYSADFSERTPITSAAPRSLYVGFSVTR